MSDEARSVLKKSALDYVDSVIRERDDMAARLDEAIAVRDAAERDRTAALVAAESASQRAAELIRELKSQFHPDSSAGALVEGMSKQADRFLALRRAAEAALVNLQGASTTSGIPATTAAAARRILEDAVKEAKRG